jgi:cytochrome P450
VHLVPFIAHHDERWWQEPERFDPARFSPERESEIRLGSYFPFGAGPRACIGKSFAVMEAQLILAAILQNFELSLPPGSREPVLETQVSLHPKHGLKIIATNRAKQRASV